MVTEGVLPLTFCSVVQPHCAGELNPKPGCPDLNRQRRSVGRGHCASIRAVGPRRWRRSERPGSKQAAGSRHDSEKERGQSCFRCRARAFEWNHKQFRVLGSVRSQGVESLQYIFQVVTHVVPVAAPFGPNETETETEPTHRWWCSAFN